MPITRDKILKILPFIKKLDETHNIGGMSPEEAQVYAEVRKLVSPWMGTGMQGQSVVYQEPRSEGDALSGIEQRQMVTPETALGDPNRGNNATLGDLGIAAGEGIADLFGVPTSVQDLKDTYTDPMTLFGPPIKGASDLVKSAANSWNRGSQAKSKSERVVRKAASLVPMGPTVVDAGYNIAAPMRAVSEGRPPTKDENINAVRSGSSAITALALAHPKVEAALGTKLKSHTEARKLKGEKVYNETAPRDLNTRFAPYVDDLETRIARGENPGKTAHEIWGSEFPTDPEIVKAEKVKQHEDVQARLQEPDMQFEVPEDHVINAITKDVMDRMVAEVGDDINAHPKLKELVERTKQNGALSLDDYDTLKKMATGKFDAKAAAPPAKEPPVKGKGKAPKQPKAPRATLPARLRETVGFIERVRAENGGLDLTPAQLNEIKSQRYNQIKDSSFTKDMSEADKTANAIKREQAHGLRKLVDQVTQGDDKRSPITEGNRRYAELSTIEEVVKRRKLEPDVTPPIGQAVMASPGHMGLGGIAGASVAPFIGVDPALGFAAGSVMLPVGAAAARSVRDFIRSPKTGARLASARKFFAVRPEDVPPATGPTTPPEFEPLGPPRGSNGPDTLEAPVAPVAVPAGNKSQVQGPPAPGLSGNFFDQYPSLKKHLQTASNVPAAELSTPPKTLTDLRAVTHPDGTYEVDPAVRNELVGRTGVFGQLSSDLAGRDAVYASLPSGTRVLSAGTEAGVLITPDGNIVRVSRADTYEPRPNIPEVLQPTEKATIGNWQLEVLPEVKPYNRLPGVEDYGRASVWPDELPKEELAALSKQIDAQGYEFWDQHPGNVGRTSDGKLVVIDGGAVRARHSAHGTATLPGMPTATANPGKGIPTAENIPGPPSNAAQTAMDLASQGKLKELAQHWKEHGQRIKQSNTLTPRKVQWIEDHVERYKTRVAGGKAPKTKKPATPTPEAPKAAKTVTPAGPPKPKRAMTESERAAAEEQMRKTFDQLSQPPPSAAPVAAPAAVTPPTPVAPPTAKPKPVATVAAAKEMDRPTLERKLSEWVEARGNAKRMGDKKRMEWLDGKIEEATDELANRPDEDAATVPDNKAQAQELVNQAKAATEAGDHVRARDLLIKAAKVVDSTANASKVQGNTEKRKLALPPPSDDRSNLYSRGDKWEEPETAENEELIRSLRPTDLLPERFTAARSAIVASPIRIGATDAPHGKGEEPWDEIPENIWNGVAGRKIGNTRNTALVSRQAENSYPVVVIHELLHTAWNKDLTEAEKSEWNTLYKSYTSRAYSPQGASTVVHGAPNGPMDEFLADPSIPDAVKKYRMDPGHGYVELGAQYIANPKALRAGSPEMYDYFKKWFGREYVKPTVAETAKLRLLRERGAQAFEFPVDGSTPPAPKGPPTRSKFSSKQKNPG